MPRANRAHLRAFGAQDARLEPYDTMVRKYTTFAVSAPGHLQETFSGAEGEEVRYETMRETPNAELTDRSIRAGDLATTVLDLATYRFSRPGSAMWSHEMLEIVESHPHTNVTFEGDLDGEIARFTFIRDFHYPYLRAFIHDHATRRLNHLTIHVLEPTLVYNNFNNFCHRIQRNGASFSRHELVNLHAATLLASDRRLVCVYDIDFYNCEQALRLIHAAVAFLAQRQLISGGSLVAINTRVRGQRLDPAELVQCMHDSAYQYKLKPIGRLLVSKAESLVAPLYPYRSRRAAEIGASPSALVASEQGRRSRRV